MTFLQQYWLNLKIASVVIVGVGAFVEALTLIVKGLMWLMVSHQTIGVIILIIFAVLVLTLFITIVESYGDSYNE